MQLQEEELRSGRGKGSNTRKRRMDDSSQAAPDTDSIDKKSTKILSAHGQASRKPTNLSNGTRAETSKDKLRSLDSSQLCTPALRKTEEYNTKSEHGSKPRSGSCSVEKSKHASKLKDSEKAGMVSFVLLPDKSDDKPIPALKSSRMCLSEDIPVCNIKRFVVEEVLPELCAAQITIRTASGVLVGHDHSLRYVRTFLWPKSKGDLVLKYSISKTTLI